MLITFNEGYQFFENKVAGEFAIDAYISIQSNGLLNSLRSPDFEGTFLVQAILNYVFLGVFGNSLLVLLMTNAFYSSLAGVVLFIYLKRLFGNHPAFLGASLALSYPAAVNFCMFGLRDPIIYFSTCLYIVSILYAMQANLSWMYILNAFIIVISLGLMLLSRPELSPISLLFPSLFFARYVYSKLGSIKQKYSRILLMISVSGILLLAFSSVSLYVYRFTLAQIGVGQIISPLELISVYSTNRYNRHVETDFGGGSAILPPDIYYRTNIAQRFFLQTIGVIVLPFPWMINSIPRALAFLDSLFIMALIFISLYYRKCVSMKDNVILLALVTTFFVGTFIMGFILVNAGNAFRMRMSITPYILISAAMVWGTLKTRGRI